MQPMIDRYQDQVRLLLEVLPYISEESIFALKGGTAINLFYRDMPRLSVDVDLTYLGTEDHHEALEHIDETLGRVTEKIKSGARGFQVNRIKGGGGNQTRIMVQRGATRVKVETSPVTRGAVLPTQLMQTSNTVQDQFGFAEIQVLAFEDLFAGKLHAALDRQHPRDLFDVKLLYENEGLTNDLFRVFMVYVASSNRPMHELLAPKAPLEEKLFNDEFEGMTRESISKDELDETRQRLHDDVKSRLTGDVATFLLSLHDATPNFDLIGLPQANDLPATQWKVTNLARLKRENPEKHAVQRNALQDLLK